jgi:DNA helicase HerA-like ATPase
VLRKAIEETYQRAGFSVNLNLEAQSHSGTRLFPTFNQVFARLEEIGSKDASTESMLVKLERVLSLPLFEERKLTLKEIFSGSKILNLVCLQSLDTKAAVSLLVLEAIYQYVLSLGETKQIRLALFVDEAHLLAGSEVLSQMMRQARKVGLLVVLGSQSPRDFAPAVLSEAGTYLGLRLEAEDARMMASYFGAVTTKEKQAVQRLLMEQTRGEALIRNDHYQPFQRVKLQELTL